MVIVMAAEFRKAMRSCPPVVARRGAVLVLVLVVIVVLTLAAYQFSVLMLAEYNAADSALRLVQARCFADSGIDYAAGLLSNPHAFANTLDGNPFNKPRAFRNILVKPGSHPRVRGRFSICTALDPDEADRNGLAFRYGVGDECGKINLNALLSIDKTGKTAHAMLMALPKMTEEIADCILDWIDADDRPRTMGAEDDFYAGLQPPYHCKNGPLNSLEELLLVRGVTPELLFGNDTNRNGVLDAGDENNAGLFEPGWSAYLTIYSREQNLASDNLPRIYLNSSDVQKMYDKLKPAVGEDMAYYIAAWRLYGPSKEATGGPRTAAGGGAAGAATTAAASNDTSAADTKTDKTKDSKDTKPDTKKDEETKEATKQERTELDFTRKPAAKIDSLYDLLTGHVDVTTKQGKRVRYVTPLTDSTTRRATFPKVLDRTTTSSDNDLPPRININTAPPPVLWALPGIQASDVQKILAHRPSRAGGDPPDAIFNTPAWLMFEAGLASSRVKAWEKYITARSQVYRVNAIGSYERGGPFARIEAIIDTNGGQPRIIYRRDLTELGKGFELRE